MFKIKSITAKNFLSIGNVTQAVNLDCQSLTLVLGSNLDLGEAESGNRNGTGKTSLIQSLSYALYGQALTNIKKENLINKINGKNMLVTVEFEKDNINYRIERGRKPNVLKLFANDQQLKTDEVEDESQGDSRETQKSIDRMLGMSHTMFKHLVALNTYTEPFLSMRAADQREIIEQLLGITLLSEKAEVLKTQIREIKEQIQSDQFKIEGIRAANENVQKSINSLELKNSAWAAKRDLEIESLSRAIMKLENVDIESELALHDQLKLWDDNTAQLRTLSKQKSTLESAVSQAEKAVLKYTTEIELLSNKTCPSCSQSLHDHKHSELLAVSEKSLSESMTYLKKITKDLKVVQTEINKIGEMPHRPVTFYDSQVEALGHKNNLAALETSLINKVDEINPYAEQIQELTRSAIQEIDWSKINQLIKTKDHQEFLHKLLTNKDSFIRKKIIDQNLSYLNLRLGHYISRLGLPHCVVFQNDLNVEITQLGQELDFHNLSRGEMNRVILATSWAFRDVWEGLYQNINLLFIDELLDNGTDASGVENALGILKKLARERNKNIYLISHRDDLVGRVNNVLRVVKENGFTSYMESDHVQH